MAKLLKPRRIFPLPVEGWIDDPRFLRMPSAGQGIAFNLILHFWRVECVDFTATDSEMRCIARAHTPTWTKYRADILSLFEDFKPALAAAYNERLRKRSLIQGVASKGHAARCKASRQTSAPEVRLPVSLPERPVRYNERAVSGAGGFRDR